MSDALMTKTSRRSFLKGFASALVATGALPTVKAIPIDTGLIYDEWLAAVGPIYVTYTNNILVFGIGALQETQDFPYVRSVDPRKIEMEKAL
ncbi:MAG TPA: hypothetical protein VGA05_08490 [Candidatus Bathyarchaeia archaeon]